MAVVLRRPLGIGTCAMCRDRREGVLPLRRWGPNNQDMVNPLSPARALLKIASRNPRAILDALQG